MPLGRRVSSTSIRGSSYHRRHSIIFSGLDAETEMNLLKEESHSGDHFLSPAQLQIVYRTNVTSGLTDIYAEELLYKNGPNTLKEFKGPNYCKLFRHNLFGWFQCVLWVGAALNFFAFFYGDKFDTGDGAHNESEYLYLGCVISFTVIGTGLFGFYQEAKNAMVMSGFEKMVPPETCVIRGGTKKLIPNSEIVIGDLVEMNGGEIVPADVRILTCTNFATDMSSLTGESIAIEHRPQCTHVHPLESKNMCYFGCPILRGSARGIVVATGENTQMGKIAGLATGLTKEATPIAKEITHFIKLICAVAFAMGIVFFLMVYLIQHNVLVALQYMLGIVLANVPEGLIVTLTVCMTLAAGRLKSKNCLAKTLQAVETLGSTSCICSDKTGTLTINAMSVSHLMTNFTVYDQSDHTHVSNKAYSDLSLVASLNLKAVFVEDSTEEDLKKKKILGDASEAAILRYMEIHRSATKTRDKNPKLAEIPFSSETKYQVSIHYLTKEKVNIIIMKGAPEIVIERCNKVETDELDDEDLTTQTRRDLKSLLIKLANKGERVIGYAALRLPVAEYPVGYSFNTQAINFPVRNLKFIGAISLIDPPRPDISKYIGMCRAAGIKVVMVTGDHPMTALAISRKCGTITMPTAYDYAFEHHIEVGDVPQHVKKQLKAAVVTGDELRKMTPQILRDFQQRYEEITYARTSPQQKLFVVENYQALNHIVAVTGDGVNDSPALKKADIGIAMGITGSEVSKQAADMILLDDNFSSIVLGIEEGRRIFDNLKKTIAYTLTSNTPEMLPYVMYACFGMPLPMTLMLIIVVNVGTDLLPAMSLAYETSEEDIMNHPPRKLTDHLVNKELLFMAYFQIGLIQFCAGMFAYYVVFAEHGFFPSTLMFVRETWDNTQTMFEDTLGRPRDYEDRKRIERLAQTSYFMAVCMTQVTDVIICKTRRVSLLKKGMRNSVLNVGIIVNLIAALGVTYFPLCNQVFGTEPLDWIEVILALPFMVLMVVGDEVRRYIIRNNLSPWVERETYY